MHNKFYGTGIMALVLCFGTVAYCFARADEYRGFCVHVADGDTVSVADEGQKLHRIRIVGMDAPELAQPYGPVAKEALKTLILHKEVYVLPAGVDKYNRELAVLRQDHLLGQIDVAETMIGQGYAFSTGGAHYKAQAYAQDHRLGVWADPRFQERPWLFRHRKDVLH